MQSLHAEWLNVGYNWVSFFKNCAGLFKIICVSMDLIIKAFLTNLILAHLKEQMLIIVASGLFPSDQFAFFPGQKGQCVSGCVLCEQLQCVNKRMCVWCLTARTG